MRRVERERTAVRCRAISVENVDWLAKHVGKRLYVFREKTRVAVQQSMQSSFAPSCRRSDLGRGPARASNMVSHPYVDRSHPRPCTKNVGN